jgi:hypothetical protein
MKGRSANQAARLLPLGALVLRKADSENSHLVHEVGMIESLLDRARTGSPPTTAARKPGHGGALAQMLK